MSWTCRYFCAVFGFFYPTAERKGNIHGYMQNVQFNAFPSKKKIQGREKNGWSLLNIIVLTL